MEEMKSWIDDMIDEYKSGRNELEKLKQSLDGKSPQIKEDRKLVNGMINDMTYSLDWLKKGRRPGNRRGLDRRAAYQRSAYMEMDILPSFDPVSTELTEETKKRLVDVLLEFSNRERECYLMHMAQGFSYQQIADLLSISRRTVQQYVERAKKKLKKSLSLTYK
ncbi:sigma-70 family RNA polymerase sigma factor [Sediminibacillus terrae]|uniref:sigma-70 family RNA polymerase sigma factor n=1 Tax=Sediminibacillus terrae TaxID=1562106 RepID=UPI00129756AC|nr:sigma-70 family RNA polymerase sigma factor [Sediminibacillus terrae]